MPLRIEHQDGHSADYVYDASGVKLQMKNNTVGMALVTKDHKDHLGNNRVVADKNGTVAQITNYYPFGMSHAEVPARNDQHKQPYKFNGKELDRMFGLDTYDYSARMYSPSIGRFMTMDPLAEKYYSISPYAYCMNSPVRYIDPTGCDTVWVLDQTIKPVSNSEYSATLYVEKSGTVYGPYEGSSFPDGSSSNTLSEGEHSYNNEYGHSSGSRKGLNLVDENGNRNSSGTDTNGNALTMTNVNVHDSFNSNRRHSEGCITVPYEDPGGFFDNFDWSGTYNGHIGTTGTSTGTLILVRGDDANFHKNRLNSKQNPIPKIPIPIITSLKIK